MAQLAVQLPLLNPPAFTPIPAGSLHYVPALLDWKGERDALRAAAMATWHGMTPLIQVAPPGDPGKEISIASIDSRIKEIARAVRSHPIFLDALGISPNRATKPNGRMLALHHVHEAARRHGLTSVPVYSIGDDGHLGVVAATAIQDGRGLAIRYRLGDTIYVGGGSLAERLTSAADRLRVGPGDTDIILDFGWLRPDDELGAEEVSVILDLTFGAGAWRNVIILATSMPASFAHVAEGTVGVVARREWTIWNELHAKRPERVAFGDYGVQHPRAPANRTGGQMRANVRYPTREGTLVARGVGPVMRLSPADRARQYRELCYNLVRNSLFVGRGCCSGDDTIQDCAEGVIAAQAQPMWRGVGTAHALREVTSSLAALRAPISQAAARRAGRQQRPGVPVTSEVKPS